MNGARCSHLQSKVRYGSPTVQSGITVHRGSGAVDQRFQGRLRPAPTIRSIVPVLPLASQSRIRQADRVISKTVSRSNTYVRSSDRHCQVVQRRQGLRLHHPRERPGPVRPLPFHPGHRLQVAAGRPEGLVQGRAGPEGPAGRRSAAQVRQHLGRTRSAGRKRPALFFCPAHRRAWPGRSRGACWRDRTRIRATGTSHSKGNAVSNRSAVAWPAASVALLLALALVACSGEPVAVAAAQGTADTPPGDTASAPSRPPPACTAEAGLERTRAQPLDAILFKGTTATHADDVDLVALMDYGDGSGPQELPLMVSSAPRQGWRFVAPVNPMAPFQESRATIRLRADGAPCGEWSLTLLPLERAPGTLAELAAQVDGTL